MFFFPVTKAYNVGYLMPNSQGRELSLRVIFLIIIWLMAYTSKKCKYCKCPDLMCQGSMDVYMSLRTYIYKLDLSVHCTNLLQKTMWQCSGPSNTGITADYFSASRILAWVLKGPSIQTKEFPWLCSDWHGSFWRFNPQPILSSQQDWTATAPLN